MKSSNKFIPTNLLLIGILLFTLIGCGNGYKQATSDELGEAMYISVKNGDKDGFLSLFIDEDDFDVMFEKQMEVDGVTENEKFKAKFRQSFDRDLLMMQQELDVGFENMRSKAVEIGVNWDDMEFKGGETFKNREKIGLELAQIKVYFTSNGKDYELDAGECCNLNGTWKSVGLPQVNLIVK